MNESTPSYYINMMLAPTFWTPEPYQMLRFRNRSYLNSLWLGIVAPVVMLPERILHEMVAPLLNANPLMALFSVFVIPATSLYWIVWGITGRANAVKLSMDILKDARFMSEQECVQAIHMGSRTMLSRVVRLDTVPPNTAESPNIKGPTE